MKRGLPVLRTCDGCTYVGKTSEDDYVCTLENRNIRNLKARPPNWCPLPRARPDRDLLRSAASRGFALGALTSKRKPLDTGAEIERIVDAVMRLT